MKNRFIWDEEDIEQIFGSTDIEKANKYHDTAGKFTSADNAVAPKGRRPKLKRKAPKKVTLGHPKGYGATTTIEKVGEGVFRYSYGYPMDKQEFTVDINGYPLVTNPKDAPPPSDDLVEEIQRYYGTDLSEMAISVLGEQWNQWEGNFAIRTIASNMMNIDVFSGGSQELSDIAVQAIEGRDSLSDYPKLFVPAAHALLTGIAESKKTDFEVFRAMVVREGSTVTSLFKGEEITMPPSGFTPSTSLLRNFRLGGMFEADVQGESIYTETPAEVVFVLKKGAKGVRSRQYAEEAGVREDLPLELVTGGKFRIVKVERYTPTGRSNFGEYEPKKEPSGIKYTIEQIEFFNPETGKYEKN